MSKALNEKLSGAVLVRLAAFALSFSLLIPLCSKASSLIPDPSTIPVEEKSFSDQLSYFQNQIASPDEEISSGNWAYDAVAHLGELGFVTGYQPGMFDGKVMTRRDMGRVVSDIFDNYLAWTKTGTVKKLKKVTVPVGSVRRNGKAGGESGNRTDDHDPWTDGHSTSLDMATAGIDQAGYNDFKGGQPAGAPIPIGKNTGAAMRVNDAPDNRVSSAADQFNDSSQADYVPSGKPVPAEAPRELPAQAVVPIQKLSPRKLGSSATETVKVSSPAGASVAPVKRGPKGMATLPAASDSPVDDSAAKAEAERRYALEAGAGYFNGGTAPTSSTASPAEAPVSGAIIPGTMPIKGNSQDVKKQEVKNDSAAAGTSSSSASKPASPSTAQTGASKSSGKSAATNQKDIKAPQKDAKSAAKKAGSSGKTEVVTEEVEEPVYLTQKDLNVIEKLVNDFKKEAKETNKALKKEIDDVKKTSVQNKRDIDRLTYETEKRMKITGSDNAVFMDRGGDIAGYTGNLSPYDPQNGYQYNTPDLSGGTGIVRYPHYAWAYEQAPLKTWYNDLSLTFTSKPDPAKDFTIAATMKARSQFGTRTGYYGYIDGTNTALSISDFNLSYKDYQEDPKHPRKFKMRELTTGNISAAFSPMTIFGTQFQGVKASFKANKYTLNVFGGRTAYHYPLFLGQMAFHQPGDDTQYDRYIFGANLQSAVFGNPASMGNISKVFMYDDATTNYYGLIPGMTNTTPDYFSNWYLYSCQPGYWIRMKYRDDPSIPFNVDGTANSEFQKDLFCLPPEKDSVTSAFVRYPLIGKVWITAEYGHSDYFKPGYKFTTGPNYLPPAFTDEINKGLVPTGNSGYSLCNTNDPAQKGSAGNGCWFESKQRAEQDDAFYLLFDYNKGPVTIFPIGYLRLGPNFVSKYLGMPGMGGGGGGGIGGLLGGGDPDDSSGGLSLSTLPISLQSIQGYVGMMTVDETKKYKFKLSSMGLMASEIQPMYIDPGALASSLNTILPDGGIRNTLFKLIDALNTRRDTLKLSVTNNEIKYFISDRLSMTAAYMYAKVLLPPTCLDHDEITISDDHGNIIDKRTGDGLYTCGVPGTQDLLVSLNVAINTQKYTLFWKTSKKAESETTFSSKNLQFSMQLPDSQKPITDLLNKNIGTGISYSLSQTFRYKLTAATDIETGYTHNYDLAPYTVLTYDANGVPNGINDKPLLASYKFKFKISSTF